MRLLAGAPAIVLGQKSASSSVNSSSPAVSRISEIIVVCKTHFDIGYSDRVEDVLNNYRTTMIDRALDLIDRSKGLPKEEQFTGRAPAGFSIGLLRIGPDRRPNVVNDSIEP